MRRTFPLLFLVFSALVLVASWRYQPAQTSMDRIGKTFPEFKQSEAIRSPQDGAPGGVRVVNFFASWCPPCAAELPFLVQAAERSDVPVIGVVWRDKPERIEQFLQENGDPFRAIYLDSNNRLAGALGLRGLPETMVLDANNVIRYHHLGPIYEDQLAELLEVVETWR